MEFGFWRRHGMHGYGMDQILVNDVINKIELNGNEIIAELGSGPGRFTIPIARKLKNGKIYAIDIDREALNILRENAEKEGLKNIETIEADITQKIPLNDKSADIVLLFNIFHGILYMKKENELLNEIKRILKDNGKIYILEFKKEEIYPPGPHPSMRVSYQELENIMKNHGFNIKLLGDAGRFHYLALAYL